MQGVDTGWLEELAKASDSATLQKETHMRLNAFTVFIIASTLLALAGLASWTYFAPLAKANPDVFYLDMLALGGVFSSIVGTFLVTLWWHGYLASEEGIRLRFYAVGSIFASSLLIMSFVGLVGFPYGFGVLITGGLSVFFGFATFPDVSSKG